METLRAGEAERNVEKMLMSDVKGQEMETLLICKRRKRCGCLPERLRMCRWYTL